MSYKSKFSQSPNVITGDITISGSITVGAWSEGYMGSSTQIILYPADFNLQDRPTGATGRGQNIAIELSTTNRLGANASFPAGGGDAFYAQKIIPIGYEAISAQVNGSSGAFTCYSGDIATSGTAQLSPASVSVGLVGAFAPSLSGSGTAYVTVAYEPNNGAAQVWGGVINIQKI